MICWALLLALNFIMIFNAPERMQLFQNNPSFFPFRFTQRLLFLFYLVYYAMNIFTPIRFPASQSPNSSECLTGGYMAGNVVALCRGYAVRCYARARRVLSNTTSIECHCRNSAILGRAECMPRAWSECQKRRDAHALIGGFTSALFLLCHEGLGRKASAYGCVRQRLLAEEFGRGPTGPPIEV